LGLTGCNDCAFNCDNPDSVTLSGVPDVSAKWRTV